MAEVIALLYQELCYRGVCYKSVPLHVIHCVLLLLKITDIDKFNNSIDPYDIVIIWLSHFNYSKSHCTSNTHVCDLYIISDRNYQCNHI